MRLVSLFPPRLLRVYTAFCAFCAFGPSMTRSINQHIYFGHDGACKQRAMEAGADRGVLHMRKTRRPPGGRTLNLRAHGRGDSTLMPTTAYPYGVLCTVPYDHDPVFKCALL